MESIMGVFFRCMEVIVVVVIAVYLLIFLVSPVNKVVNENTVTVTVTDHGIKRHLNSDKYLVYCETEDGETTVFEITDSVLKFRFNSSDLYADIKPGKTYEFTTCGYRVPFLSWYPNIYGYKEVDINDVAVFD